MGRWRGFHLLKVSGMLLKRCSTMLLYDKESPKSRSQKEPLQVQVAWSNAYQILVQEATGLSIWSSNSLY